MIIVCENATNGNENRVEKQTAIGIPKTYNLERREIMQRINLKKY